MQPSKDAVVATALSHTNKNNNNHNKTTTKPRSNKLSAIKAFTTGEKGQQSSRAQHSVRAAWLHWRAWLQPSSLEKPWSTGSGCPLLHFTSLYASRRNVLRTAFCICLGVLFHLRCAGPFYLLIFTSWLFPAYISSSPFSTLLVTAPPVSTICAHWCLLVSVHVVNEGAK